MQTTKMRRWWRASRPTAGGGGIYSVSFGFTGRRRLIGLGFASCYSQRVPHSIRRLYRSIGYDEKDPRCTRTGLPARAFLSCPPRTLLCLVSRCARRSSPWKWGVQAWFGSLPPSTAEQLVAILSSVLSATILGPTVDKFRRGILDRRAVMQTPPTNDDAPRFPVDEFRVAS
ncbi:hypothetical protein PUNSTDRAFT_120523 [Punctularia strigosozonata HHB-11173 SS5]|uniref:uncharacterized protein n=1 Tax=Punctularia strigosozonata (strain HHB-11173) TaxID=741275 RepID=UPI0004417DB9|nr:uncharacterized protein PUNSTDRAFT_120523 [Punctularia strigosozonata HHB-11173 SS5]EIN09084.1 hypothetical protein PUNSTDRAFT_120523 [Punctularia strigosozonata HHB-11173 SS5]